MADAESNPLNHPQPKDGNPDKAGHYQYGSAQTGKFVSASWRAEIEPLLRAANKAAYEGPIKGDGSKL
jgi:hypothetical protein